MGLFKIKTNDGYERRAYTLYLMKHKNDERFKSFQEKQEEVMQQEREEKEGSEEKKPLM